MADLDLQAIRDEMILVAHEAGAMMLKANPADIGTDNKLNSVDIVTEADKGIERMVSTRLLRKFPSVSFMGEETYKPGSRVGPEPTFIVDPIDGTTNFVHGFPNACISLGLSIDKTPFVGVIYNPWRDLLYTAIRGSGAFVTRGRSSTPCRLPLSKSPRVIEGLAKALVGVEWGSQRDGPNFDAKTTVFRRLAASPKGEPGGAMCHSVRSLGCAALSLAAVASGELDMYWEGGIWAWDVCAGWCILSEAGGIMVSGNPGNWDPEIDSRVYLAVRGAPSGQKEIVEEFWSLAKDSRLDYSV